MGQVDTMKNVVESRMREYMGYRKMGKRPKPLLVPVRGDNYGHININMKTEEDERALSEMMKELAKQPDVDSLILIMDAVYHEKNGDTFCLTGLIHSRDGVTLLKRSPYLEVEDELLSQVEMDWEEISHEESSGGFFSNPF